MAGQFLDIDGDTGAVETFHYDESDDKFTIARQSRDLEPTLDHNAYWQNDVVQRGGARKVASIPIDAVYELLQHHGINVFNKNHKPALLRLLNSSEYWRFRTGGGRLGGAATAGRGTRIASASEIKKQLEARRIKDEWFA